MMKMVIYKKVEKNSSLSIRHFVSKLLSAIWQMLTQVIGRFDRQLNNLMMKIIIVMVMVILLMVMTMIKVMPQMLCVFVVSVIPVKIHIIQILIMMLMVPQII